MFSGGIGISGAGDGGGKAEDPMYGPPPPPPQPTNENATKLNDDNRIFLFMESLFLF